jgi:AraC family transcriptional regulator of adaptative response/methylated-DNA-[protein]-cysteine methyltransferase
MLLGRNTTDSPFSDVIVTSARVRGVRVLECIILTGTVVLDPRTCDRARLARDARFDGRFFSGVLTTRIYCRPTCPVKPAKSRNVVFFPTAAAAERGGFRPCLRCRPETAPGTAAWRGAAATVTRALRLIEQGYLDDGKSVEDLADALGMTSRHLRRLFLRYAGASPSAVAMTRRVQRAKRLVDETATTMSAIAFAAGFRSIRRFNAAFRAVYRRPPTAMRKRRRAIRAQASPALSPRPRAVSSAPADRAPRSHARGSRAQGASLDATPATVAPSGRASRARRR